MATLTTCYRNGRIHSPAAPHATALMVRDDTVAWLGAAPDAPAADRTVDLAGALLTPAFVDAHVHLTDTGLTAAGLDLSTARSATEVLDAVAAAAGELPADGVLLGHGWDESTWPEPTPPDHAALDRAAGGRPVYLSQASLHSAVCSSALIASVPAAAGTDGFDPSGWVRRNAHHAAREAAFGTIGAGQRRRAQRTALARAAAAGIAAVHECGGPDISSEADFTAALAPTDAPAAEVYGYWGELLAAEKARELGAVGAGGDLFADGALGARTAHVRRPYEDCHSHGHGYLTAEQVADHLVDCHRQRIQGGFHAIGDAALATVLAGFRAAAEVVGLRSLRAARHRIEHAELADRAMIADCVELGVVASMQPAFDRLWGGHHQMYAHRLGRERALATNPMGAMHAVGVPLAFGSDAPVTPLDPWGGVRAAVQHHNPTQRLSPTAAFAAHTRGGWRAVGQDDHGVLAPGAPATFAIWDSPAGLAGTLPVLDPDAALPTCRRTVLRGRVLYDQDL